MTLILRFFIFYSTNSIIELIRKKSHIPEETVSCEYKSNALHKKQPQLSSFMSSAEVALARPL